MASNSTFGALAEFTTATSLYNACEQVRDAGFSKWDAHTPFPVHGLEDAMGVGRSKVPWVSLVCGFSGAAFAFLGQCWVAVVGSGQVIVFSTAGPVRYGKNSDFHGLSILP